MRRPHVSAREMNWTSSYGTTSFDLTAPTGIVKRMNTTSAVVSEEPERMLALAPKRRDNWQADISMALHSLSCHWLGCWSSNRTRDQRTTKRGQKG